MFRRDLLKNVAGRSGRRRGVEHLKNDLLEFTRS